MLNEHEIEEIIADCLNGLPLNDRRVLVGATATGPDGRMYLVGGMGIPVERRGRRELLDGLDIYDAEPNT